MLKPPALSTVSRTAKKNTFRRRLACPIDPIHHARPAQNPQAAANPDILDREDLL